MRKDASHRSLFLISCSSSLQQIIRWTRRNTRRDLWRSSKIRDSEFGRAGWCKKLRVRLFHHMDAHNRQGSNISTQTPLCAQTRGDAQSVLKCIVVSVDVLWQWCHFLAAHFTCLWSLFYSLNSFSFLLWLFWGTGLLYLWFQYVFKFRAVDLVPTNSEHVCRYSENLPTFTQSVGNWSRSVVYGSMFSHSCFSFSRSGSFRWDKMSTLRHCYLSWKRFQHSTNLKYFGWGSRVIKFQKSPAHPDTLACEPTDFW